MLSNEASQLFNNYFVLSLDCGMWSGMEFEAADDTASNCGCIAVAQASLIILVIIIWFTV